LNLKNRKWLDLLALLLISVFVISASGAIYYAMLASSTSTVAAAAVYFKNGSDSTGILTLGTNNTYARLNLNAYPNVTLYYDQAVNLTATVAKQIRLRPVSISPDGNPSVSNFTSVVFRLLAANGVEQGSLSYTTSGTSWTLPSQTGYFSIGAGVQWTVKIEIKAAAGAKTGVSTDIVIAVDVI
jgi:hypothetical protein